MDDAPPGAVDFVIVNVHEVHAGHHQGAESLLALLAATDILVDHAVECVQQIGKAHARRGVFAAPVFVQLLEGRGLGQKLAAAGLGLEAQAVHVGQEVRQVDELGHRHRLAVAADEHVGAQGAVRVAGQVDGRLVAQGVDQPREGLHARQREEVAVGITQARLAADVVGQVGQGVALGQSPGGADPPTKGNRLEGDAGHRVDVGQGVLGDRSHLVVVDALDNGRHKDDLHVGAADLLDGPLFEVPEPAVPRSQVGRVREAVELQIQVVQARLLAAAGEVILLRDAQPVGRDLDVRKAHLAGGPDTVEEPRMKGRFAAGELDHPARHGAHLAEGPQHLDHLLVGRFIDVALGVGIGEADRAPQVAAVGQVDVAQGQVAGVMPAQAAIVRAIGLAGFGQRVC